MIEREHSNGELMKGKPMFGFLVAKGKKPIEFVVVISRVIIRTVIIGVVTIRRVGAKDFLQFLPHTIAIVGLLTAVEYFSGKPNLHIALHPDPQGFYLDTAQKFYEVNKLEIPRPVAQIFGLYEKQSISMPEGYVPISAGTSDLDLVRAIRRGQDVKGFLEFDRIKQLEKQLHMYNYRKQVYVFTSERGFYREGDLKRLLNHLRTKLSIEEYFTFLTASIFSREVSHNIFLKNDGDLDLRELHITIFSPLSKVTETRKDNILDHELATTLPHDVRESPTDLTLLFPTFRRDENFSLRIQTRENQIEQNDIFYSFKAERAIDFQKAVFYTVVFFLGFTFLGLVWKKKTP